MSLYRYFFFHSQTKSRIKLNVVINSSFVIPNSLGHHVNIDKISGLLQILIKKNSLILIPTDDKILAYIQNKFSLKR